MALTDIMLAAEIAQLHEMLASLPEGAVIDRIARINPPQEADQ